MSRSIQLWLDDETDEALALLCSGGGAATDVIRAAIIAAAIHADAHHLINDPSALEKAFDKSHDFIAEVQTTQRPPR